MSTATHASPRQKTLMLGTLITLAWAMVGALIIVGALIWQEAF